MYTGTADHTLTAELVERVSVPVIASGDVVDRRSAERVLDSTGAAAVMVGRGAQGQPWTLQEMAERGAEAPEPGEVVAELIRFMREVEREMGDRAASFLRKFYGWYLRGMPDAKSVKPELTSAPTVAEAEAALLRFCPEARDRLAGHEAELALLPDRSPTGCSTSRSRSTAADRRGGSGPRPPDSVASAAQRAGTSAPNDA